MNRLLSILVTLFILFLVYLWIRHLTADKQKPEDDVQPVSVIPELQPEPDDTYVYEDDDAPSETPADTIAAQPVEAPPVEESPKQETPKETPKTEAKPETKPVNQSPVSTTPVSPPKSTPAEAGMHLVIAGNFLTRANAEERVKELKKLGYAKAEVVNFELSEYHTACAGRYGDLNEARRVAKKIKDMHAIDTYVRHGN
jgi:cell division septation protein DedD